MLEKSRGRAKAKSVMQIYHQLLIHIYIDNFDATAYHAL